MMADSVRVVDEDYVGRIHSRNPSGHLHKGHGVVAASSSIPTRYQTIVTDNADKKGFLARTKRFANERDQNENPGPGSYMSHTTVTNNSVSPSYSKKGTGGFASKSKRQFRYEMSSGPGPGIYGLPGMLTTRKDFNQSTATRIFHKPIAETVEKGDWRPAPNQYDIVRVKCGKTNNVTADAAFKSKSKRDMINVKHMSQAPAPCQYDVRDDICYDSTKVPMSSFKSTSIRRMAPDPPAFPGPGAYKPWEDVEEVKKQIFPRKHYLCISAPAMPLPKALPAPGPGTYDSLSYFDKTKHYMSSAAFVSTTGRWNGAHTGIDLPGPAHYKPSHVGRQSFIYNAQAKWL